MFGLKKIKRLCEETRSYVIAIHETIQLKEDLRVSDSEIAFMNALGEIYEVADVITSQKRTRKPELEEALGVILAIAKDVLEDSDFSIDDILGEDDE